MREEHLITHHPELVRKYTSEAQKVAKELGIILRLRYSALTSQPVNTQKTKGKRGKLRSYFNLYVSSFIHPNLNVVVCCDAKETFGNLKDTSFRDIWNGSKYSDARRKLRNNEIP